MGALLAFNEVFPASVGVIEDAHDSHHGEASARFLVRGLRVTGLVLSGVVKLKGASVDGFNDETAVGVFGADVLFEMSIEVLDDCLQKVELETLSAFTEATGIRAGSRESSVVAPALDEAESL